MSRKVRVKVLKEGMGDQVKKGDALTLNLQAFLPKGELAFEQESLLVELGKRRVFPGLEAGLVDMKVGETREVNVPPHLAYGSKGAPNVPPNAALKLIVQLLEIKKR